MELGNLFSDVKGETQALRTNVSVRVPMRKDRGGTVRSSVETPVMGVERRDSPVQF